MLFKPDYAIEIAILFTSRILKSHDPSSGYVFLVSRKVVNAFSENVGKKMNLRAFKLNCVYFDPLNMSNAGDVSCS